MSSYLPCHPEPKAKDTVKKVLLRGKILRAKALRMTEMEYLVNGDQYHPKPKTYLKFGGSVPS